MQEGSVRHRIENRQVNIFESEVFLLVSLASVFERYPCNGNGSVIGSVSEEYEYH